MGLPKRLLRPDHAIQGLGVKELVLHDVHTKGLGIGHHANATKRPENRGTLVPEANNATFEGCDEKTFSTLSSYCSCGFEIMKAECALAGSPESLSESLVDRSF